MVTVSLVSLALKLGVIAREWAGETSTAGIEAAAGAFFTARRSVRAKSATASHEVKRGRFIDWTDHNNTSPITVARRVELFPGLRGIPAKNLRCLRPLQVGGDIRVR